MLLFCSFLCSRIVCRLNTHSIEISSVFSFCFVRHHDIQAILAAVDILRGEPTPEEKAQREQQQQQSIQIQLQQQQTMQNQTKRQAIKREPQTHAPQQQPMTQMKSVTALPPQFATATFQPQQGNFPQLTLQQQFQLLQQQQQQQPRIGQPVQLYQGDLPLN